MSDAMDDLLPQGNRLQILSPEEYELLWGLPQFTMSEQQLFFALTPREQSCYERLRTRRTKVHFLPHLGYFKARQRFYVIDMDLMSEDIAYLSKFYFEGTEMVLTSDYAYSQVFTPVSHPSECRFSPWYSKRLVAYACRQR